MSPMKTLLPALSAAVLFVASASAQPGRLPAPTPLPPPVEAHDLSEELRQALLADPDVPPRDEAEKKATRDAMLAFRKSSLERLAGKLQTLRDLSRVLVLREWRYSDPDNDIADIDLKVFQGLEQRFQQEFKKRVD